MVVLATKLCCLRDSFREPLFREFAGQRIWAEIDALFLNLDALIEHHTSLGEHSVSSESCAALSSGRAGTGTGLCGLTLLKRTL